MTSILTDHDVAALRAATPGTRSSSISTMRGPRCRRTARWTRSARTCCAKPNAARWKPAWPRAETETARALAARLFNAQPDEIALTGGNSPGWGSAFAAFATAHPWQPGDRILVGRHEWGGNLACMRLIAERAGARVETIPSDQDGCVDPEALRAMLDERVRLIALTWLPANGGLINPAAAIGAVAREHGIAYFVDAAQAVGQLPIDVEQVGCDVLAGAGRKALRGRAAPACCTCGAISCPG